MAQALDGFNARAVRRLALIEDDAGLDPASMTLLGAGEDVDVVKMSVDDAPTRCAPRRRGLRGAWRCPDGGDAAVALLDGGSPPRALRELPMSSARAEPLEGGERARLDRDGGGQRHHRLAPSGWSTRRRCSCTAWRPSSRADPQAALALRTADAVFHGKRVLIVDDDIRNVFALTSVLETRGMKVVFAENGREGIDRLRETSDTDLVLLDVMMPEMDGYETARAIRGMSRFDALPIISLTAKAMKGDRDKCIAAGASDYITKPVDVEQLLSLMRVWLHR